MEEARLGTSDKDTREVSEVDNDGDTPIEGVLMERIDIADPVDNIMSFSYKQIEATLYRIAQISVGISWSSYMSKYEAGILAAHASSVFLVHLHVPNIDRTRKLVERVVSEGLDHFYSRSGTPRDKPRGTLEIKFVHPESTNVIVEINKKA